MDKEVRESLLVLLIVVGCFVYLLVSLPTIQAFDFASFGIALGGAAIGTGIVALLVVLTVIATFIPIGLIVAALGIIIAIVVGFLAPGDDEPEQSDDQGDGRDVFEDEEKLDRHLQEERQRALLRSYCDEGVPPISAQFTKRELRVLTEYTYSYTLAACDSPKAFFVRLNGTSGQLKTEFHSVPQGEIFENSETRNSKRDFSHVCFKIIGVPELRCFGGETTPPPVDI